MPVDTNEIGGFIGNCRNIDYLLNLRKAVDHRLGELRHIEAPDVRAKPKSTPAPQRVTPNTMVTEPVTEIEFMKPLPPFSLEDFLQVPKQPVIHSMDDFFQVPIAAVAPSMVDFLEPPIETVIFDEAHFPGILEFSPTPILDKICDPASAG